MPHPNAISIEYLMSSAMIIGVIASSISGALRAIEAKMDITGAVLLAFLTSNAGGTIRDLILNTQVFWIRDQFYIWLTIIFGSATFILVYFKTRIISNRNLHMMLIITDAMGLAAFCVAGVEKSLDLGTSNRVAILMGALTAVGGGIIADITANKVPLVFSKELYIIVAIIGAICFILLTKFDVSHDISAVIAIIIMIALRLCSVRYQWKLPIISSKYTQNGKK